MNAPFLVPTSTRTLLIDLLLFVLARSSSFVRRTEVVPPVLGSAVLRFFPNSIAKGKQFLGMGATFAFAAEKLVRAVSASFNPYRHNPPVFFEEQPTHHEPRSNLIDPQPRLPHNVLRIVLLAMQLHRRGPNRRNPPQLRHHRNPRQLPLQFRRIPCPVLRMMQQRIVAVEDIPLRNRLIPVMLPKLPQRPIDDVLPSPVRRRSPGLDLKTSVLNSSLDSRR